MISFKGRAFCGSEVEVHTCGRELKGQELADALESGLPVAYGDFCS